MILDYKERQREVILTKMRENIRDKFINHKHNHKKQHHEEAEAMLPPVVYKKLQAPTFRPS